MYKNRKGQTATEYMIILAIVIIIALIVVGVLGGIPGIGRSTGGNTASAYWTTSEIGIPSYAISNSSGNDTFTMVLQNNKPSTITISEINVSSGGSTNAVIQISSSAIVIAPGGQQTVTSTGSLSTEICASAGDSFASNVKITYTNDDTGVTYEFTGDGNRLEGTCGQ